MVDLFPVRDESTPVSVPLDHESRYRPLEELWSRAPTVFDDSPTRDDCDDSREPHVFIKVVFTSSSLKRIWETMGLLPYLTLRRKEIVRQIGLGLRWFLFLRESADDPTLHH